MSSALLILDCALFIDFSTDSNSCSVFSFSLFNFFISFAILFSSLKVNNNYFHLNQNQFIFKYLCICFETNRPLIGRQFWSQFEFHLILNSIQSKSDWNPFQ
jgi:hypothetical protein